LPTTVSSLFPSAYANSQVTKVFLDKFLLSQVLDKLALPHPYTVLVKNKDDLNLLPESVFSSAFFKPRNSDKFFVRFGVKGIKVQDHADAVKRFSEISAAGFSVLLQEYIPGPPTVHYFVDGFLDGTGTLRASFARRRIRMHPRDFGNSTYMVSIPITDVHDALEDLLKLLRFVGYRGIFSAEFKLDSGDGRFKLLEVNVRPWWYVEFAQFCGVDVCGLAYKDALGQPLETIVGYETGQYCVHPFYDLQVFLDGDGGKLFPFLWSWMGARDILFSLDDPVPAIAQTLGVCARHMLPLRQRSKGF